MKLLSIKIKSNIDNVNINIIDNRIRKCNFFDLLSYLFY